MKESIIPSGTSFEVEHEGEHYSFFTRLMGAHNAINIALCIPVAEYLGVSKSDIIGAVYDLKPVPHRLELIKGNRNITILDDTYNSNPDGAQAALSVLKSISGRKVVVTPGLVEMGEKSKEENNKLGQAIASAADVVILIRSRESEYIKEGLKEYNGIILYYDSLREATIEFSKTLSSGDVLLLLNDLPDNLGG